LKHYTRARRGKPLSQECSVDGCNEMEFRLHPPLCEAHYAEEHPVDGVCRAPGCTREYAKRGLCTTHFYRLYEQGRLTLLPKLPPEERFWAMVTKTDDCWLWTGGNDGRGYGRFEIRRRSYDGTIPAITRMAHRYAYELLVGPIPDGCELDHVCEVRNCVRPDHVDPVTKQEHARRTRMRKTHCKRGHELAGDNVVIVNGARHCLSCRKIHNAKKTEKRRALRREMDSGSDDSHGSTQPIGPSSFGNGLPLPLTGTVGGM